MRVCFCVPLYVLRALRVLRVLRVLVLGASRRSTLYVCCVCCVMRVCCVCVDTCCGVGFAPNSWPHRDTTSACTCSTCTPDMIQTIVGAIASVL